MKLFNTKIACIACILLAMIGCRPRGVLSNREMRDVLYDLHRADGAIQTIGYNYSHDHEVAGYYKNVLDKHGITQVQFDSSLVWYTNNPQIFNKIYPKVIERLHSDFEQEKLIREQNRAKRTQNSMSRKSVRQLPDLNVVMAKLKNPPDSTWKIWQPAEFCEKNVIIFGQLKKK